MTTLRDYQQDTVNAIWEFVRTRDGNPCAVLPTGAGKSVVLARLCSDVVAWGGRVLCVAHVKELLQQAYDHLRAACATPVGLYSAGLKKRQTEQQILVAGIQSIYSRAEEIGAVDVLIVDEAHLIPSDGEGMYLSLIKDLRALNPNLRIVGLTATPYRMDSGMLFGPDNILTDTCIEIQIRPLIDQGFLCPLISNAGTARANLEGVHKRGGEFIPGELEVACNEQSVVDAACAEIVAATQDRKSILVFTAGVRHCENVTRTLRKLNLDADYITGETKAADREKLIREFKTGSLRCLVNVNVLTTGFDAPNVDAVILLRPTESCGLYYQMVGRGFRKHASKTDTLILDFGGNIERHGPVDAVEVRTKGNGTGEAVAKICPECGKENLGGVRFCACGFIFPRESNDPHGVQASKEGILAGQVSFETYAVIDVSYRKHLKKNDSAAPPTLRVDYHTSFTTWASEWVCFEHTGFARQKAEQWWRRRSRNAIPDSVDEALSLIDAGAVAVATSVTVKKIAGEKWDRISDCVLEERPAAVETQATGQAEDREPGEDDEPRTDWSKIYAMPYGEEDVPF